VKKLLLGAFIGAIVAVMLSLAVAKAAMEVMHRNGFGMAAIEPWRLVVVFREDWWDWRNFFALGLASGVIIGMLWGRFARHVPTPDAPASGKSANRALWRVFLGILLLLAIVASTLVITPVRYAALAWRRGDKFYHGMPASYWIDQLKLACQPVKVQPDAEGLVAIFGGFAVEGLIKIIVEDVKKDAVPDLIEMLNDANPSAQAVAVKTLQRIGPSAAEATPVLIKLLETNQVRPGVNVFWVALKKINPEAVRTLAQLSPPLAETGFIGAWASSGSWPGSGGPGDYFVHLRRIWLDGGKLVVTNANYDKIKEGMTWNDLRESLHEKMTWDDICKKAPWKVRANDKVNVYYICEQGPHRLLIKLENGKVIEKEWSPPIPFGLKELSEGGDD
jgi:hypothetical protein